MKHLIFFFYILSFSSGIASIAVAILLYFQHKKIVLKYYSLILISLSLMMITLIVNKYIDIVSIPFFLNLKDYTAIIYTVACTLFIIVFPSLIHNLLAIIISPTRKRIFLSLDAVIVAAGIFYLATFDKIVISYVIIPVLQLILLYGFVATLLHIRTIGEKTLKIAIIVFFIITLFFWPLFILEVYRDNIQFLKELHFFELFTLPLYFVVINLLALVFSIKYLNQPPFWKDDLLTEHFNDKYGITERESVIISYLVNGLSNNEISKKLFISIKTVENHLSNIYTKVNVKNRVQLVNIILTNS